jgi:hypothetical protein
MGTEDEEAMVEDVEKDPLTTDIPPCVLFVNDCLCAQGTEMGEVEAMVKDMEEPLAKNIPSRVLRPHWRIWRRIHWPQIFLCLYYLPMIVCVPRGWVPRKWRPQWKIWRRTRA